MYCARRIGRKEAFNDSRDNQAPRPICVTKDGNIICTSWANYNTGKLANGESRDIANFAVKCGQSGGGAEFKAITSDGNILYICVSNRAKSRDSNVCRGRMKAWRGCTR
jgi:putative hemolysin